MRMGNKAVGAVMLALACSGTVMADESLLGYVKGAETLPDGAIELDQTITYRDDKGEGSYHAWNTKTEIEYGVTDRFTVAGYLKMQAIDTSGLIIDGYLPEEKDDNLRISGWEASMKYNFLSPARDDFGLAGYISVSYDWIDPHSGQDKDTTSVEFELLAQKYFLEGQLIWMGNTGLEATYAKRDKLSGLPDDFDWPTDPEMEIGWNFGTGVSYRVAPNWFVGVEALYETEFETEVGQERWSWFAGPSVHYANQRFWVTLSWLGQVSGGGETYEGQPSNRHLIEKTEDEFRLKFGIEF